MFESIEHRKQYVAKLEASKKIAKLEDLENKRMLDQYRVYTEDEWEQTRE
jgi:DnaJ family protein C protein 8